MAAQKIRLDKLLIDCGVASMLEKVRALILAKEVLRTSFCREKLTNDTLINTNSKSEMILRRLGGGDEAYCTYVEEADNDANKNSALI